MAVTVRAPFPAGTAGTIVAASSTITTSVTLLTGDDLELHTAYDKASDTGITLSAKLDPTGANLSPDGSSIIVHSNGGSVGFEQVFWWLNSSLSAAGLLGAGAKNVTVTVSSGTADSMEQKAYALTGADHNAPTVTTASGSGATASVTSASCPTNGLAIGHFVGGSTYTATNNTNTLNQSGTSGNAGWNIAGNTATGAGSTISLTGTLPSDFWGAIATVWAAGGAVTADSSPNPIWAPGWRSAATSANTAAPISEFLWLPQDIGSPAPIGSSLAVAAAFTASGTVATGAGASLAVTATLNAGSPTTIVASSSDGQYLVDQNGNPRLFVCDDNWSMVADGGAPGTYTTVWNTYFSNRRSQGYTAVEVSWCSYPNPNVALTFQTGQDWDGTWPWGASQMDPTGTADATFWGRRDTFLTTAASYGFTVVMNITTPSLDMSPTAAAQKTWSTAQWQAFGTFLGNRYKNQPNLMWIFGDDYFGGIDSNLSACLTNIRAAGDTHLASIQNYQEATSRQDLSTLTKDPLAFDVHAQYEWGYSYNVSYDVVERAQLYTPTGSDDVQHVAPPLWADGFYLASGTGSGQTDVRLERQMIWWALSSGACGFSTGDNDIWIGGSTWPNAVTSKSFYTSTMPAITTAFKSLPNWHLLAPDTSSLLVTGGRGTHASAITSGGGGTPYIANTDNYVTASRTPDTGSGSSLAVIYCGLAMNITIDQTKIAAGYTVTWVDPVSGATFAGTPGSTYNSATARGNNSAGDPDWVLVLQAPTASSTGATLAVTSTITAVGAVSASASLTATAAPTAAGNVATSSGATLAVTANGSATGGAAGAASLAATAAINASAGGLAGSATIPVTSAVTAAGIVAASAGASLAVTATSSASSSTTGASALGVSAPVVAAGNVATGSGASLPVTAAVIAGSTPQSSSTLAVTATVSASGTAGNSTSSALSVTAAVTAAGVAAYQGQAVLAVTATEVVAGVANYQATATQAITVAVTATGSTVFTKGAAASLTAVIVAAGVVVTKVAGTASAASMTVPTASPATMNVPKATGG